MLNKVSLSAQDIDRYRLIETRGIMDEVVSLGKELKGLRVCHVNSTPFGGGVAELLVSYIPLLRGLGIKADWQIIRGNHHFFTITKGLHNALQGARFDPIKETKVRREYLSQNLANARELDTNYDVFIINDPQPAALRHFLPEEPGQVDLAQPHRQLKPGQGRLGLPAPLC